MSYVLTCLRIVDLYMAIEVGGGEGEEEEEEEEEKSLEAAEKYIERASRYCDLHAGDNPADPLFLLGEKAQVYVKHAELRMRDGEFQLALQSFADAKLLLSDLHENDDTDERSKDATAKMALCRRVLERKEEIDRIEAQLARMLSKRRKKKKMTGKKKRKKRTTNRRRLLHSSSDEDDDEEDGDYNDDNDNDDKEEEEKEEVDIEEKSSRKQQQELIKRLLQLCYDNAETSVDVTIHLTTLLSILDDNANENGDDDDDDNTDRKRAEALLLAGRWAVKQSRENTGLRQWLLRAQAIYRRLGDKNGELACVLELCCYECSGGEITHEKEEEEEEETATDTLKASSSSSSSSSSSLSSCRSRIEAGLRLARSANDSVAQLRLLQALELVCDKQGDLATEKKCMRDIQKLRQYRRAYMEKAGSSSSSGNNRSSSGSSSSGGSRVVGRNSNENAQRRRLLHTTDSYTVALMVRQMGMERELDRRRWWRGKRGRRHGGSSDDGCGGYGRRKGPRTTNRRSQKRGGGRR